MSLPLVYQSEAREDIDAAYAWYEEQRTGLGEEFLTALRNHLQRIQDFPQMYAILYRQVRGSPCGDFPTSSITGRNRTELW